MQKSERKALALERDRIRAQLAAIAEVKNPRATPTTSADAGMEDALRGRLEELDRLLL